MKDCIYVILVNYKNVNMTMDCITSIKQSSYDNYHIVVIDNASNDGSIEAIEKEFPNVNIIKSEINGGFGYTNNLLKQIKLVIESD